MSIQANLKMFFDMLAVFEGCEEETKDFHRGIKVAKNLMKIAFADELNPVFKVDIGPSDAPGSH